jgi:hypothetical protein
VDSVALWAVTLLPFALFRFTLITRIARDRILEPMPKQDDLPIIQRMYDLVLWYVPRLNKRPRDYKFALGDRIQSQLYAVLEGLIRARRVKIFGRPVSAGFSSGYILHSFPFSAD